MVSWSAISSVCKVSRQGSEDNVSRQADKDFVKVVQDVFCESGLFIFLFETVEEKLERAIAARHSMRSGIADLEKHSAQQR